MSKKRTYLTIKRTFDIIVSFLGLIILSPLMLIIGLLIVLTSHGGPFYFDKRYGKNKKVIKVIKFRTMKKDDRDIIDVIGKDLYLEYCKNFKLIHDPRVTKLGKVLRKTSLDELPQLINILKGDMSLVGPRPIAIKEYDLLWYSHDEIFQVRPGLTGLWAVSGRSAIRDYKKRIALESTYIKKCSISLDIKILFMTVAAVFKGKTS